MRKTTQSLIYVLAATLLTLACESTPGTRDAEPKMTKAPGASLVPAGVGHLKNASHDPDMETPKDMPEMTAPVSAAATAKAALDATTAALCKKGSVLAVQKEGTRFGYVSYKNEKLPVAGLFEEAGMVFTLGGKSAVEGWINVLSVNSGDPVRDRKLLKLFFEAEKPENAVMRLSGTLNPPLTTADLDKEMLDFRIQGMLELHGKPRPIDLPFHAMKKDGKWSAALNGEHLLELADFGLLEPLKALMKSCNHAAMGDAVKLDLTLALADPCA